MPGSSAGLGLPCDVAAVFSPCWSCHGTTPTGGAPISLATYEDLSRASPIDSGNTNAHRSVLRMQGSPSPMPPAATPTVPAADVAVVSTWIAAGMPPGDCAADGGGNGDGGNGGTDPFSSPPVCTSGRTWDGDESEFMRPGEACISCHLLEGDEAPLFQIAGTVYPTAHEPNDCEGVPGNATVEITGANGTVFRLSVNRAGNFYLESGVLVRPYRARVLANGNVRAMLAAQQEGDCNSCHTQNGANLAPGRIILP